MKGVDRAYQYLSYYSIIRRNGRVMYFLNCALYNSYKALNPTKRLSYKQFLHMYMYVVLPNIG